MNARTAEDRIYWKLMLFHFGDVAELHVTFEVLPGATKLPYA